MSSNIRRLRAQNSPPGTTTRPRAFLAATGLTAALTATLALTGCSSGTDSGSAPYPPYTDSPPATSDIPDGFHSLGNGLAVKSPDTDSSPACMTDIGSCYQILVWSARHCSVYVRMNGLDASGTVIDYANDTADVDPGQTALLTFQFTQDVDSIQTTDEECN